MLRGDVGLLVVFSTANVSTSVLGEILLNNDSKKMAIDLIADGVMTIERAEEVFGIKLDPVDLYQVSLGRGFYDGKKPEYWAWADYIISEFSAVRIGGALYLYNKDKNHYVLVYDQELNELLSKTTNKTVHPQHRSNFLATIKGSVISKDVTFNSNNNLINLKNGVLNIKTGELFPHSSNFYFNYCLDHNYDKTARCDKWMSFLDDVFLKNTELKIVAAMIFGYCLLGGDPFLHRAFVLFGEGRNGKSTFLDVLKHLLGRSNFSIVGLSNLDKPFSVISLKDKMANIVEETPNDKINAEIFKTAIGGGNIIGSEKYQPEHQFKCNARFIFACNEMPKFSENSVGLLERLYFIPFKAYFEQSQRDPFIGEKLLLELPGILNWALSGLELLLDDKSLPRLDVSNDAFEQYRLESDSVYSWASDVVEYDVTVTYISSKLVYDKYRTSASDSGKHPVNRDLFQKRLSKFLKEKCPNILPKRDKVSRGYSYLKIKNIN